MNYFRFELPTSLLPAPPRDPTRRWPTQLQATEPSGGTFSVSGAGARTRVPPRHMGIQQQNQGCVAAPGEQIKHLLFLLRLSVVTTTTL